jgi:4,5-DOPA dioxygenase extradiol
VHYPAPGNPDRRVQHLLAPVQIWLDDDWGLDHGAWAVLKHVFPNADILVVQLSFDATKPPIFHHEMGTRLKLLREEGVLIIGNGNMVHNLAAYDWKNSELPPFDSAVRFEESVWMSINSGDHAPVVDYPRFGSDASRSVPTPEHYLPLLYVIGLRKEREPVSFPVQGMDGG